MWSTFCACSGDLSGELLMFGVGAPNPDLIISKFMWPWNMFEAGINERPFIRAPSTGRIRSMAIRARTAGAGATGIASYILEINSVDTALRVDIPNGANPHAGNTTGVFISVAQGDRISVELDWDVLPTVDPSEIICGMYFEVL